MEDLSETWWVRSSRKYQFIFHKLCDRIKPNVVLTGILKSITFIRDPAELTFVFSYNRDLHKAIHYKPRMQNTAPMDKHTEAVALAAIKVKVTDINSPNAGINIPISVRLVPERHCSIPAINKDKNDRKHNNANFFSSARFIFI